MAETSGYSLREAGELADVSHQTVAKWRRGEVSPLQPATRRGLQAFLDADVIGGDHPTDAPEFFRSLDAALAHFKGIAPPGAAQARKKLAWESLTDAAKHFGWPVPDDWYEIPGMVDEGEI